MNENCGIYQITHTPTKKVYVGSSVNIKRRWQKHVRELNRGDHHNNYLQRVWTKYGAASFTFTVVEVVPKGDLLTREQFWIDKIPARGGFNLSLIAGRPSGHRTPHTEEAKIKIRKARASQVITPESIEKTRIGNLGLKRTEEFCLALSKKRTGMQLSEGHKANIAKARTGTTTSEETKKRQSEAAKGHQKSEVHRARLSAALTGKKLSPETIAKRTATRRANGGH